MTPNDSAARAATPSGSDGLRAVLEPDDVSRALTRIAHEILERNKGATDQVLYLAEYQNHAWHERLREENLPYETAEMVIQRMDVQWRKRPVGKGQKRGLGYGRMAGNSFNAEFA